jgi:hypothetical protein
LISLDEMHRRGIGAQSRPRNLVRILLQKLYRLRILGEHVVVYLLGVNPVTELQHFLLSSFQLKQKRLE